MRKVAIMLLVALGLFVLSGCAVAPSPLIGFIYANTTFDGGVTTVQKGTRTGEAVCKSVLYIAAWGDCSIDAAKKKAGITSVNTVDHNGFSVLGIYSSYSTIVTGE